MKKKQVTPNKVRSAVREFVRDIKEEYRSGFYTKGTDRDTLKNRMDEECDAIWQQLVKAGRLDQYGIDDLLDTVQASATIIEVAEEDAWVEDDSGLWEGMVYVWLSTHWTTFSIRLSKMRASIPTTNTPLKRVSGGNVGNQHRNNPPPAMPGWVLV